MAEVYNVDTEAPNKANIENDIDIVLVKSSLITGGWFNKTREQNVLHSFPPFRVGLSELIVEAPNPPIYLPLIKTSFDTIDIDIMDDEGRYINFGGSNINLILHYRQI